MCGIVGYAGYRQAAPVLLDGLSKLEYRGYDSAGVCIQGPNGLEIAKSKGRLQVLEEKMQAGASLLGTIGVGHTRWATHGAPSDENSHPHLSYDNKIAVVHNGIIENYLELREQLLRDGISFDSDTDTEVVSNLIAHLYAETGNLLGAIRTAVAQLEGSYALGILCQETPGQMVAVKKDSPLIFGFGEGEHFIASDVPAILKYTRQVAYLDDGDMAVFTAHQVAFYNAQGNPIPKNPEQITWELADAERGGYPHFMLKEIHEQPRALRDTISPRIQQGKVVLDELHLSRESLAVLKRIYVVACGSAYYVGCLAKYLLEQTCQIPVEPIQASEFRYANPVLCSNTLVLIISQSGETADTLAALREAKRQGARTLAIVNVVGSAIAKAADQVIYTWAGPEIAVATTKALLHPVGCHRSAGSVYLGTAGNPVPGRPRRFPERPPGAAGASVPYLDARADRHGAAVCLHPLYRSRRLLHRPKSGQRHLSGGQPEAKGNRLHPLRGLRRRRTEAWSHFPH